MINSWTEKVQPLYLGTAGCLVFDLWRVESSGIYDAMFKSETSLVTHRISLDSWLATSPTCLTSVAWLFKGIVRVFWGALPKTRICSSGQKLSMVHACIKKGTYGMSLWSRIPTCPSLLLTPLYLLSLSKSLWGKKKSLWEHTLWRLVLFKYRNWCEQCKHTYRNDKICGKVSKMNSIIYIFKDMEEYINKLTL